MKKRGWKYTVLKPPGIALIRFMEFLITLVDHRPGYIDPKAYVFTQTLEDNWKAIRMECDQVLSDEKPRAIQEVFQEQVVLTRDDRWKSYIFTFFGYDFVQHHQNCPKTSSLLAEIPGLSLAMFSVLAPGKHLPPHRGIYKGLLRYHLGLIVPDEGKLSWIKVSGVKKHWEEGKSLVFDDTFIHEAKNGSDKERVVLFVDFVRPLPFPLNAMNRLVLWLLQRSPMVQGVLGASKQIEEIQFQKRRVKN